MLLLLLLLLEVLMPELDEDAAEESPSEQAACCGASVLPGASRGARGALLSSGQSNSSQDRIMSRGIVSFLRFGSLTGILAPGSMSNLYYLSLAKCGTALPWVAAKANASRYW